jgi:hypothetical protein
MKELIYSKHFTKYAPFSLRILAFSLRKRGFKLFHPGRFASRERVRFQIEKPLPFSLTSTLLLLVEIVEGKR